MFSSYNQLIEEIIPFVDIFLPSAPADTIPLFDTDNPEIAVSEAQRRGVKTISGLDMFIGQAIASIEIWLNTSIEKKINIKKIKNILKAELCLQE